MRNLVLLFLLFTSFSYSQINSIDAFEGVVTVELAEDTFSKDDLLFIELRNGEGLIRKPFEISEDKKTAKFKTWRTVAGNIKEVIVVWGNTYKRIKY